MEWLLRMIDWKKNRYPNERQYSNACSMSADVMGENSFLHIRCERKQEAIKRMKILYTMHWAPFRALRPA